MNIGTRESWVRSEPDWTGLDWIGLVYASVKFTGDHGGKTTTSNLTHVVSREENGLPLTCEAFNMGTRFSRVQSTNLVVFYPPQKVWLEPQTSTVPLRSGTTVRLVCFSTGGSPKGTLTWYKNGKALPDYPKQVLFDKGVSKELVRVLDASDNKATFRCAATNKAEKTLSASVNLMVHFPPEALTITVKQKVLHSGQNISLECLSTSSNPKVDISWRIGPTRLQGVNQAPAKSYYGGVSVRSILFLPLSSQLHGQRVTCEAHSSLLSGGVNTFYKLDVLYPPEFSPDQPQDIQVVEDEAASLSFQVSGNPADISCIWRFHQEELRAERDPRYHLSLTTENTALEIWNVTRRDSGVYTAVCTNEMGSGNTSTTLDVQYAPSVKMEVNPVYVNQGEIADLLCVADANPIIRKMFSWEWLGDEGMEEIGEQSQDQATGLLTIRNTTRAHAGRYQCTADNKLTPAGSTEVLLVVRFKPELHKGSRWNKVASRGDGTRTAEVACQGEGIPQIEFSWTKNGVLMDFTHLSRYQEKTQRMGPLHTSTITVVNVSAALDYAVFTCTARNSLGEDTLNIQLLSTNHPDPPSKFHVVSFTHASVTLTWIPGFDGGLEQRFRVRYNWTGSASFLYVDVFPPTADIFTVTGLFPATAYSFSVNALNSLGEGRYADNNTVLTITTEVWKETVHEVGDDETTGMSMYQTVILSVVGGASLLALNWLGCFLCLRWKKKQGHTGSKDSVLDGKKSSRDGSTLSTESSSTRYEVREQLNPAAQHTFLTDPGSEPDSSIYESYAGDTPHYYYPTSEYRPSLYTHPEGRDGRLYAMEPMDHEYEEVRDWRTYQDVAGSSVPRPPSQPGYGLPENKELWRSRQGSGRRLSTWQQNSNRMDPAVAQRPQKNHNDNAALGPSGIAHLADGEHLKGLDEGSS
ncbi:hypothetical protein DPEC_G00145520 [Dallia pectoralis]|uniref:Uncharacterized protein n=1 Tax=Dallia pectoralis TaxID=75939 RepID=A0ACC2GPA2_DALPE|nr:hypothetical protein DPEC_G00145520 [Dallia pectoralis]